MPANHIDRHRKRCEEAKTHFRNCVQSAREERGWSQADLAEMIGCSASVISRIETGPRPPTGDQLFMLCSVLELSCSKTMKELEGCDQSPPRKAFPLSRNLMIGLIRVKFEESDDTLVKVLKLINLETQDDVAIRRMFHQLWGDELPQQGEAQNFFAPEKR